MIMRRAFIYTAILVGAATTTGAVLVRRANDAPPEACALQVRNHLARMAVVGHDAKSICEGLIARHPEYWESFVKPRVVRSYDTPESHVSQVCEAYWAPRLYLVYDLNYDLIIGSYGRNLCELLEDHDPAVRLHS
jgi:hypothetical protein